MKVLVTIITLLAVGAAAKENQTLDGCQMECGDIPILFPFGAGKSTTTGKKCFLEETFRVTCVNGTLYSGKIQVLSINIVEGQVDAMVSVAGVCVFSPPPGSQYIIKNSDADSIVLTSDYSFSVSSKDNKFITVCCDSYGYLNSFDDDTVYSTGCLTRCYGNTEKVVDGSCSGIGCCQVDIPPGMRNISIKAFSFENFNRSSWFNNCSYSFVVKNGNYTFSKSHLENLPYKVVPVVIDWSVGGETCEASRNRGTNACKGNSTCVNSDTGYGYRCKCDEGFQGNPYHPDGCTGNSSIIMKLLYA
ncbi:hypothetical protein PIB30_068945 [Stylosanthes scabra]|uniref:EGF-like domain-containing protein n=1 Tax=Stylosanthes scabra TaxID=79078 RepID=A0ABU6XL85_9FABA|nr:hypothetical protein [Stylosanthes scabra]